MHWKYLRTGVWLAVSAFILLFAMSIWQTANIWPKLLISAAFGLAGARLWDSGKLLILSLWERRKYQKLIDESFQTSSDKDDDE